MTDGLTTGVIMGALVGAGLAAIISLSLYNEGRDECQKHLTRTEHCVKIWVNPKEMK